MMLTPVSTTEDTELTEENPISDQKGAVLLRKGSHP
jgi:hypothetical protein